MGHGQPIRPTTAPRYHAIFDPPPQPKSKIEQCPECDEFIFMREKEWMEPADDEGNLRPHVHQPPSATPGDAASPSDH